ncbi:ribonuclease HIII [Dolosicoccus paucivorans]|uniref:Ribonuclease HIII n=1 Tax=Dolosicoccus paucivorans TaxID=84521 RepID=A0A2N6SNH6_9LACT|nr:ribonuclease HIII [Dolosicoccus paucivorans]PMB83730.1 ribonuclease HIII [Dolosicoccus paucivorans]PMC58644.1 ribonuclease HIII [Dolosicoccus paucivorans]
MSYITLNMSPQQIEILHRHYQNQLIKPVPHSLFRVKTTNGVTITAYKSGKVLFQGNKAIQEASQWEQVSSVSTPSSKSNTKAKLSPQELPANFSSWTIIGSDEVGNGSYFGPLTVCAVYLDRPLIKKAQLLGAKDSKQLTDQRIRQIAAQLKQDIPYALTICTPTEYNQLNQTLNANAMKVHLHNLTIQQLYQKLSKDQKDSLQAVFIDEFTSPKRYKEYLKKETNPYQGKMLFARQGEGKHLTVACASIIAREAFLTSLEELGKPYGLTLPSGAGANVDRIGRQLVKDYGRHMLPSVAKMHFANTNKIT